MEKGLRKTGFTLVELVVVLVAVVVVASLVYPIFANAHRHHIPVCTSNIRQIATAVQMYAQDNAGQYPGIEGCSWVQKIGSYLGNSKMIFQCDQDKKAGPNRVSYGYSGLLIRSDGSSIREVNVSLPSEVGCVCDAAPLMTYPNGGIIGTTLQDPTLTVQPQARHSKGIIAGFCDGHAKYMSGVTFITSNLDDEWSRAFYQVAAFGLVNNPAACVPPFTLIGARQEPIDFGGEYALYPLLFGAAQLWQIQGGGKYVSRGCKGQFFTSGRKPDFAWGVGDGKQPAGPAVAIARDAVVVIVAKSSKIPSDYIGTYINDTYEVDYPTIRHLFSRGYEAGTVQVYQMPRTGTHRFLAEKLGDNGKLPIGPDAVTVANDLEMVDKVANDAYGIGYCSSVFADPQRVTVLALRAPDGKVYYYPQQDPNHRWELPAKLDWPLARTLYVQFGGKAWIDGKPSFGIQMLAPGSPGMNALHAGPLFKAGYYSP